ncbi:hypothetical protein LXL04_000219 [Taraxacum kok-saghyz]
MHHIFLKIMHVVEDIVLIHVELHFVPMCPREYRRSFHVFAGISEYLVNRKLCHPLIKTYDFDFCQRKLQTKYTVLPMDSDYSKHDYMGVSSCRLSRDFHMDLKQRPKWEINNEPNSKKDKT